MHPNTPSSEPHFDVVIIGAGLSGIGAAWYLQKRLPAKSYAILESRGAIGGTWDLFRYPGIRSDSDVHTYGFAFKPWDSDESIAKGGSILAYLRETAAESGIDKKVRLHHKVCAASWSSNDARWVIDIERTDTGERLQMTCNWLFCAGGYYRYEEGFTPRFEGRERFQGRIVHPQKWPDDLDYAGKRVVVIGSGATAVTLVPAIAEKAGHVTMLQRTPTYILPLPSRDPIARALRKVLPRTVAYDLTRRKNIAMQRAIWHFCRRHPRAARRLIRAINARQLPKGYPIDEHFNPPYDPWDQRLCIVPDGDLFKAIREGRADVVTGHIETFTERGIRLKSGREIEADIIVTATGLNLQIFGGITLSVDGARVHLPDKIVFKGMMLDGVPNFAFAIGYINASWTLKVGLLCEHFCRLLAYMDARGYTICRPERDSVTHTRPLLDFDAGYVKRSLDALPRQGERAPWLTPMDYYLDKKLLDEDPVEDRNLCFSSHVGTSVESSA